MKQSDGSDLMPFHEISSNWLKKERTTNERKRKGLKESWDLWKNLNLWMKLSYDPNTELKFIVKKKQMSKASESEKRDLRKHLHQEQ